MSLKKTKNQRVPLEVIEDIGKALDVRFRNNLITRRDLKLTEGFRLIRRTPEWNLALEKVKKFPKKEGL